MKRRTVGAVQVAVGLLGVLGSTAGWAAEPYQMDEMLVTSTRLEVPLNEVGSSMTVITGKELEQQQKRTVLDALRSVPGLDVVQQGGSGGVTSVFMRGANSVHTLVVIDGVEMNDPMAGGRYYDFAHLTTDNIERIEVLRGAQSTLYGSDAIGGVINIITKRGSSTPTGFLSAEGGTRYTTTERAALSGSTKLFNFSLGASRTDSSGISAASQSQGNREKDGYGNGNVSARIGITPTDNFDLDAIIRYTDSRSELDNGGGAGMDDPNYSSRVKQVYFRGQGTLNLFSDRWEQKLGVSLADHTYRDENGIDATHPSDLSRSSWHGQTLKVDWNNVVKLCSVSTVAAGVEWKEENGNSDYYSESMWGPYSSSFADKLARTIGGYFQNRISLWNAWFTTVGLRVDDFSSYDTRVTYQATSRYSIAATGTSFKGSFGTGFKSPSLYQLYSPYGDQNLNPEKSFSWDAGIEQVITPLKLTIGAIYFNNRFRNLIDYDWSISKYGNVGRASSEGVELTAKVRPIDELTISAGYTFTQTEDKSTGLELLRRPKQKVSANIDYSNKRVALGVGFTYAGARFDNYYDSATYSTTRVTLKDYPLFNLSASYNVTDQIQLFGRIENLFDQRYETIYGYGNPGFSTYGGVKVSL